MKKTKRGLLLFLESVSLFLDTHSLDRASGSFLRLARDHFPTGAYRTPFERQYDGALAIRLKEHAKKRPGQPIDANSLFRGAFVSLCKKREFWPKTSSFFEDQDEIVKTLEREAPRNFPLYHDADRLFKLLRRLKTKPKDLGDYPWSEVVVAVGPTRKEKNVAGLLQCSGLILGHSVSTGDMTPMKLPLEATNQVHDIDIIYDESLTAYGGYRRIFNSMKNILPLILDNQAIRGNLTASDYDFIHIGSNNEIAVQAGYKSLQLDRHFSADDESTNCDVIPDLRDVRYWSSPP